MNTGEYCYRAVGENEYGRPGESTTTKVNVTGIAPDADFDYYQPDGTTIDFTDDSSDQDGEVVTWEWDFGDGSAGSSEQDPTHEYDLAGTYQVTLTVTDDSGVQDEITKPVQVLQPGMPFADFSYYQFEGTSVEFYDYSSDEDGNIVSWEWDFGDGSLGSTQQEPTHTFPGLGTYQVTLTITDDLGNEGEVTLPVELVEVGAPFADFDWYQTEGTTLEFYDYSYDDDGAIVSWDWDFGDGSAGSTDPNPTHEFPAPGDYDVTLTVTDDESKSGSWTYEVTVYDDIE
jgi:PKD repeat protein